VNKSTASRKGFWAAIARIFLVEVLVLVALSGAVVFYLNWSSNVAFSEFLAASQQTAASNPVIHAITGQRSCERGAMARLHGSA
jgi:flagellar basal body-associated protein FliL